MRISIKHLLLGMSLGAAIVSFYGYNKLIPLTRKPVLSVKDKTKDTTANKDIVSLKDKFIPEIANYINNYNVPQAQFMVLNSLTEGSYESERKDEIPTATPKPTDKPTPYPTISHKQIVVAKTESYEIRRNEVPTDVLNLIEKYASQYGVSKDMMIHIAKCESGFRSSAVNGPYAGIYQFVSGTWISNRRAMGLNENPELRYNAEEAVKTAAFKMGRDGYGAWPVCQNKARQIIGFNPEI